MTMVRPQESEFIVITSLDQVPTSFPSEREEAEFWDTHTFSDELWDQMEPADDGLTPFGPMGVQLELDADTAERLRDLGERKGISYIRLAQRFVSERLYEEELREGIVPRREAS